ncbi:MAG: glycoside hydrolase family 31 protein [Clostridia bacterium]|nr:glycoside hydrolase family 31 protein [Clostridia bacterium]
MKRRILVLLLLLCMLVGTLSCGPAQNTDTTVGDGEETTAPGALMPPENLLPLASAELTDYVIVYPAAAKTNGAKNAANMLQAFILEKTGVTLEVKSDVGAKSAHEILVGRTTRIETAEIEGEHTFEDGEFTIRVIGEKLCVFAIDDQALSGAINYLTAKVLYINEEQKLVGIASDYKILQEATAQGSVAITETKEDEVLFSINPGAVDETFCRLTYTGKGGWRIQTKNSASEDFEDIGASQRLSVYLNEAPALNTEALTVTKSGNLTTVSEAGGSKVEINTRAFNMDFYTPSGKLASTVTRISSNVGGSEIRGALTPDEALFGTGERFNAANQRGKYIELYALDIWAKVEQCYMAIPLLSSSRGSGIFINRYEYMTLDLGKANEEEWVATIPETVMDCYIFATDKIAQVLDGYSALSGYAKQPEEWTYGMLMCRFSSDLSRRWGWEITNPKLGRNEGVYDCIAKMEQYDLPWTGVLAEGWGVYLENKHEELKELCDYVHSLGKKFLVWIRVGTIHDYMSGYNKGYLLSHTLPDGTNEVKFPDVSSTVVNPDLGTDVSSNVYLDITDPDAVEWFFDEYWTYVTQEIGVDGVKIDFCEYVPETNPINYYDKSQPTAGSHHWYPTAFCARFFEMLDQKADGGMCFNRGGGIGSQRAAYMWAGDQLRNYDVLQQQLTAVLSSGLSGVPFMSYDMGGYHLGSYNYETYWKNHKIEQESVVFVRATQYTAFTLCMQTHGNVRRAYDFAEWKRYYINGTEVRLDYDASGAVPGVNCEDQCFTTYGGKNIPVYKDAIGLYINQNDQKVYLKEVVDTSYTWVTDVYRAYTKLHEVLTPYITEHTELACTEGMPVMRHLILQYQDDKNVYGIEDEYMFGDAFLVAPIVTDKTTRDIYLPEGEWLDLNTGEKITVGKEGKTLTGYTAKITQLPVFYNMNTESETAEQLLPAISEIFAYLATIQATLG